MELQQLSRPIRILAIDDDPLVLRQYQVIFEDRGMRNTPSEMMKELVNESSIPATPSSTSSLDETLIEYDLSVTDSGSDGYQKVVESIENRTPYAIILLDMRMPMGWGGLETAERIREVDQDVKIIFITAFMDCSLTEIRKKIGYEFDFLSKPFNLNELEQLTVSLAQQWNQKHLLDRALERADRALEHANMANSAKDQFLASMSHELRTPLTTIIGNIDLLAEQEHDPTKLNMIQMIRFAGDSQLTLINDILDASKIEAGQIELTQAPYDLGQLIGELGFGFSSRAVEKGLHFRINNELNLENKIIGDAHRVRQILSHLISNAIKFTEEGEVTFSISSTDKRLHFVVEDTGAGISKEDQKQLFQRFGQLDQSHARCGGSGMGLYISEHLAQLMGGSLEVTSEPGQGAKFHFQLPYLLSGEAIQPIADETQPLSQPPQQWYRGKVLFADDTEEMRVLVERQLRRLGIDTTTVENGQQAMESALGNHYDLILMDMQMPVMDGIEATAMLRLLSYEKPIVAMTANVMESHRQKFKEAGCDDFLGKPVDREALLRVLDHYLERVEDGFPFKQPDESSLINDDLSQIFIKGLSTMKITLMTALQDQQWSEVRGVALNIKGSGTMFGHPELTRQGREICEAIDLDDLEPLPELVKQLGQMMTETIEKTLVERSAE